jgi:3-dehydroquinate dehydratase-1
VTLLTEAPLVVGTVAPAGLAALVAAAPAARVADVIEARIDLAMAEADPVAPPPAPPTPAQLRAIFESCRALEATGTPVLATIRLVADGGRWNEDAPRLPLFEAALADGNCTWVDVEVESAIAAEVVSRARRLGRRVIVSHHDFAGTPEADDLDAVVTRARALNPDVIKLATRVDDLEGHDRLTELLRRHRGQALAVIGMGAVGRPLRSYLPAIGSRLTYGFVDAVAAPGQVQVRELVARLVADCPAYAARHEKT